MDETCGETSSIRCSEDTGKVGTIQETAMFEPETDAQEGELATLPADWAFRHTHVAAAYGAETDRTGEMKTGRSELFPDAPSSTVQCRH